MNNKKIVKALGAVLQYGWMWGYPRYISMEDWQSIKDAYKELNSGKEFKPDTSKKAKS